MLRDRGRGVRAQLVEDVAAARERADREADVAEASDGGGEAR